MWSLNYGADLKRASQMNAADGGRTLYEYSKEKW